MAESIVNGKRVLAVDSSPDTLKVLERAILGACPQCEFDRATTYEEAVKMLEARTYDAAILDIMGSRAFDLRDLAVSRNSKIAMFPTHVINPQALERALKKGALAYIPKENQGDPVAYLDIVAYLESILTNENLPGWLYLAGKLMNFFESSIKPAWKMKPSLSFVNSPK